MIEAQLTTWKHDYQGVSASFAGVLHGGQEYETRAKVQGLSKIVLYDFWHSLK